MAQANYTPIQLYRSTTASAVPTSGNLADGELAINTNDGKLYYKDSGGIVQLIASKAGASGDVVGPASATDNAIVRFDGATGKLVQNSVVTIADSTGDISGVGQLNATTVDATNVEVTNIKAKDGTAAATIADSTGVVSITANPVLSGGTANGVLYLNGSKVATSGSALTFDGTSLKNAASSSGATPSSNGNQLVLESSGNAGLTIATGATSLGNIFFADSGDNADGYVQYDQSGRTMRFGVATAEQMRLTSTGLGIGTSSPGAKLELYTAGTVNLRLNGSLAGGNTVDFYNYIPAVSNNGFSIAIGGTNRLSIDSSGNLGLGVTPSAWSQGRAFEVFQAGYGVWNGTASAYLLANTYYNSGFKYAASSVEASHYYQYQGAHVWSTAPSGTAGNAITFTQAMTLDASGNLGVGITNPGDTNSFGRAIDVRSSTGAAAYFRDSDDGTKYSVAGFFGSDSSAYYGSWGTGTGVLFYSAGTERARITSGGYFKASNTGTYLGSTGSYHELRTNTDNAGSVYITSAATNGTQYGAVIRTVDDQNDATRYFLTCEGSTTERATIRSNGGLANYSANNVNLASDERLKKDIAPLSSTWSKVKDIEVVNFRYKDCNEGDPALYGVIAQQVQPIVPELVVVTREATETDPEYYGIREQPMYWLAIKALQEAMARIETLEAKVAQLEGTQP